jgi:hypothetical protein
MLADFPFRIWVYKALLPQRTTRSMDHFRVAENMNSFSLPGKHDVFA